MSSLKDYYINRNAKLIRSYKKVTGKGLTTREAYIVAAASWNESQEDKKEEVSSSLVKQLITVPDYPYAKEAWEIVNAKKENTDKNTVTEKEETQRVSKVKIA